MKLLLIFVLYLAAVHGSDANNDRVSNLLKTMASLQQGITDMKQDFSALRQQVAKLKDEGRILKAKTMKPMKKVLPMKIEDIEEMEIETKAILEDHMKTIRDEFQQQNSTIVQLQKQDRDIYNGITKLEENCCNLNNEKLDDMGRSFSKPIKASDCSELMLKHNQVFDGVYTIYAGSIPIQVYCDMSGGGWTVFQRRFDGSENFHRTMAEYSSGFGSIDGEHWLGLNNVHLLTLTGVWMLQVDVDTFKGERGFSRFRNFKIGSGPGFALHFEYERGMPYGPLSTRWAPPTEGGRERIPGGMSPLSRGQKFSTWDVDQDSSDKKHCARELQGAWWYTRCWFTNLNAYNYGPPKEDEDWRRDFTQINWQDKYWALKRTTMKIRLQN